MILARLVVLQTAEPEADQPVSWYPEHISRHPEGLSQLLLAVQLLTSPATELHSLHFFKNLSLFTG